MAAGAKRTRLLFQRRPNEEDEYGNPQSGAFETIFEEMAELVPLKGTESVIAERLTGVQPYVVRVSSNSRTRAVDASWRLVDARKQTRVFNITSIADMDQKNRDLDILAREGVAT
jgi:head-tail adaptor